MRISVKAIPVEKIIKDLSKQWQVPIVEDAGEQTLQIPDSLGTGFVRGTSFASGIGVITYNCTFHLDYEILFSTQKIHPLKFIFCSQGAVHHSFEKKDQVHSVNRFQNIIVSSGGANGHLLRFKAQQKTHITSIEIIRSVFAKRKNLNFTGLNPILKELFQDTIMSTSFYHQGNYSVKSADIIENIDNKNFQGFLKSIFLEGKLFEMLALQITQFHTQQENVISGTLRKADTIKVERAANLIKENVGINYSVGELAYEVETNANKLQNGFKVMFGMTINKFAQEEKLKAAKQFLSNSEYKISEIVDLIGLNNRSYFSKIFKEKYGFSPRYFLKEGTGENEKIEYN